MSKQSDQMLQNTASDQGLHCLSLIYPGLDTAVECMHEQEKLWSDCAAMQTDQLHNCSLFV